MRETRELAAILVADVVRCGLLAGAHEDRTLARLRGGLINRAIAAAHRRIVKRVGFTSVMDAARSAIEVESRMAERNAPPPEGRGAEFSLGVHGEVVDEEKGDRIGAARIPEK
jgi:adenylate cyclase